MFEIKVALYPMLKNMLLPWFHGYFKVFNGNKNTGES